MPINDQTSKPTGAEVKKDLQPRKMPTGAEIRKRRAPTNTSILGAAKNEETKPIKSNTINPIKK